MLKVKLTGVSDVLKRVEGLKDALQRKIVRNALQEGTRPILLAARRGAPRQTGTFARSMSRKVKTFRNSGVIVAVIGARRGIAASFPVDRQKVFRRVRGRTIRFTIPSNPGPKVSAWLAAQKMKRTPTKYAHLIERKVALLQRTLSANTAAFEAAFCRRAAAEIERALR